MEIKNNKLISDFKIDREQDILNNPEYIKTCLKKLQK